ncbi:hypothetical protein [Bacillus sp. CHD6a]|uniref:hypothetical protein n=1 Tax=Bacillus sp. CHD6a TaxID=1643452 RepID=UPI0006CCEC4A|nr:hypothetical protein [Bacillus sp. CHD6a]KPB03243.1 hypothetical protein AAV98_18195 [Bacillus sp. CHD6a]
MWKLDFYMEYEGNIIDLLSVIFAWGVIAVIIVRIYRVQNAEERPRIWKIVMAVLLGLFSFSFTFPLFNENFSIAILPLGVWILYGLLNRRERWEAYSKYAWTGFLGNFIFLGTALLAIGLAAVYYPKDEVRTYLTDVSDVELLVTHPSGEDAVLDITRLDDALSTFRYEDSDVIQWFEEIREQIWSEEESKEPVNVQEKFPYLLTGVKTKTREKMHVYLEQDGKGLLITTKSNQYYFKSKTASFLEVRGHAE